MDHVDHVRLISNAILRGPGVWADLGSGEGAFTLALRELGGKQVEIYSIDKDKHSLAIQEREFAERFPQTNIHFLHVNFTEPLKFPQLDGILMANSLHYIKDHVRFLTSLRDYLKPGGKFVLVEYNADYGNMWVPYPLSFETFQKEAIAAGFQNIRILDTISSQFLDEIYAAEAIAT
jgi:SAM-dependent methyltransferase